MRTCEGQFSVFWICFSLILLGVTVKSSAQSNQYYTVRTIILPDGTNIDEIIINGPPTPPVDFVRITVDLPEPNPAAGINILPDVPAFNWSFGCSATSAAMISGYYDRTGYPNMYTGPTNGGVMPMDNSSWSDWIDSHGDTLHQCPLSATHNSLDGRTIPGHVDDYWIYYGQPGPDPWEDNGQQHIYGDCTGDYMKTNQWIFDHPKKGYNVDGSTIFYNYTNGAPLYWYQIEGLNYDGEDGGYGHKQFYESRGYTVINMYNQYIDALNLTYGFTYNQYKAEIDAGRPVMIHITGHTMVGLGYNDATNLMYIHDTWDYNTYTMTWGGSYYGMDHMSVTIVQLGINIYFTNGADASLNYQQSSPSPPHNNWPFGQFSLAGSASGATLNSVTVTLGGTYTADDLSSNPFCLYANSSNDFGTATAISGNVADPGSGNNVTFSSLSDNIPHGTRYYWVTADISGSATNDDNINGTIDVSSDVNITGGTLNGSSSYGKLNAGSDVSLPVELSSFTATASEERVTLKWITQSEIENVGFIVERSQVEKGSYVELSSFKNNPDLQGRGNSAIAKEYCFIDNDIESGLSYYYKLADVDMNGVKTYHGPISVTTPILSKELKLYQNYPNPFNPTTTIEFNLPYTSEVTLKIFNILGEEVATLVSDRLNAGNYSYEWARPAGMASGVYLYRLEVVEPLQGTPEGKVTAGQAGQGFVETRKMVLMQ
jgi:hypothetical protein